MGRHRTGSKSIIASFSYSTDDINIVVGAEKKAAHNNFPSFSAYLLNLMKEDLERQNAINPIEPNSIGIIYNDKDALVTTTITEQPKGPTLEDFLETLDKLPEIYEILDAQQVNRLEAKLFTRLKEIKEKNMYFRNKALYDRIYNRDKTINEPVITK